MREVEAAAVLVTGRAFVIGAFRAAEEVVVVGEEEEEGG